MNRNNIPIYNINIDEDDCFMSAISLVSQPAIEVDFLAFDKQEEPRMIKMADAEKRLITGPVCLADTPIYRRDAAGEYYIIFTKDVIEKMMLKYSELELFNAVNLQHNDARYTDRVKMVEFYIKNTGRGISPSEFENAPEGSLFATFKVLDDGLWNDIKRGDFKGYSLEIFANLDRIEEDDFDREIEDLLR